MEDIEWRVREKSDLSGKLGSFLVRTNQHVDDKGQSGDGSHQTDDVQATGEGLAELVDHQGTQISEAALIADGEPGPLGVVHLTLDSADRREAGSAQQVEHQKL